MLLHPRIPTDIEQRLGSLLQDDLVVDAHYDYCWRGDCPFHESVDGRADRFETGHSDAELEGWVGRLSIGTEAWNFTRVFQLNLDIKKKGCCAFLEGDTRQSGE